MGIFVRSVDNILKRFHDMIDHLHQIEEHHNDNISANNTVIAALSIDNSDRLVEIAKARKAREAISQIVAV